MAVAEKRKSTNIWSSIMRFVKANFEDTHASVANKVAYGDLIFDVSQLNFWVVITALEEMAGKKGFTLIQFAVYSRVGGRQTGDEYSFNLDEVGNWLHDALHVDAIPIYDYSTKASPTLISKAQIIVRNSDGKSREPEGDVHLDSVDDIATRILTYRFITLGDVSRADRYYD